MMVHPYALKECLPIDEFRDRYNNQCVLLGGHRLRHRSNEDPDR